MLKALHISLRNWRRQYHWATYEATQWYLKTHWRYPQSNIPFSCVPSSQGSSTVVDQSFNFEEGLTTTLEGAKSSYVHRYFTKGLVCSLEASNSQCSVNSGRVKAPHKQSRAKNSVSIFLSIRKSTSKSKFVGFLHIIHQWLSV